MKTTRIITIVLAVSLCAAVLAERLGAQARKPGGAAGSAGVCDVAEILNNYQKAKDLTADLNRQRDEIMAEARKRRDAIEEIQKELKGLNPDSKEYEQRFLEVQRLRINREAWLKFKTDKAIRDHGRLTREMYADAQKYVAVVAKRRGFKVVLYRRAGRLMGKNPTELLADIARRTLLYSDPAVDVTAEVLSAMNEAYRAER